MSWNIRWLRLTGSEHSNRVHRPGWQKVAVPAETRPPAGFEVDVNFAARLGIAQGRLSTPKLGEPPPGEHELALISVRDSGIGP